jgi:hypothetical protein
MVKKKSGASSSVRQAEKSVKAIQARSKQLLKRAELDVRGYRKQLTALKKQGIVSKRINTRSHQPTKYMLGKLRKFKGVALGHELAVPITKISTHRARQYTEKGIASQIGKFLVVPKTAVRQKADVYKGHIRTTTELKRGVEEVIKFPARLDDMHDVLNWLAENEQIVNELKGPKGQLGFQLAGHNSRVGLANVRELIKYLQKYDGSDPRLRGNIFGKTSKNLVTEFVLIRFRPGRGETAHPQMEPYYGVKRYSRGRGKDRKDERRNEEYRRENERKRKARQRMAESAEAHEQRLERQRQRDRARANDRRERRMAKRLLGD